MAVTNEELVQLAGDLERNNAREMIIAATAMHLASNLLSHFGAANSVSLQPHKAMLEEWAAAWLRDGGRDPAQFAAAVAAVHRAGETVRVLEAIPS